MLRSKVNNAKAKKEKATKNTKLGKKREQLRKRNATKERNRKITWHDCKYTSTYTSRKTISKSPRRRYALALPKTTQERGKSECDKSFCYQL